MPTANEIRQQFIDFFCKKHGHTAVPSSSVVPLDDPTLLFTNAGMNQFKDVFLGTGARPYKRAVDTQKCIRAGGKHNDLEDVGRDTYHHTFFEMLGNWSFGDYYKREAIQWAWELLTKEWGLDKSRLHATVFGGDKDFGLEADEDAAKLWTEVTDIDPTHVHHFGKKDNFWMMGETGPCGPCSEIHIDRTPDKSGGSLVNAGDARVMEIWNLVFIQYNRDDKGTLHLLPAKHVDTGMGFERVTAVLQDKASNYDTDVFTPLMDAIGQLVGKRYGAKLDDLDDVAFRVIADHLRMLTFSITDGGLPSNKGRGSVIRSVVRRAILNGYQRFGQREPFVYKLVPALVEHMAAAFPELRKNPSKVQDIIRTEEADFLKTLDKGLVQFEYAVFNAVHRQIAKEKGYEPFRVVVSYAGPSKGRVNREAKSGDDLTATLWFKDQAGKDVYINELSNSPESLRAVLSGNCHGIPTLSGEDVFNLYTTLGFPPDLTRQMVQKRGLLIDEEGFANMMKEHEETSRSRVETEGTPQAANLLLDEVLRNALGKTNDDHLKWRTSETSAKIVAVWETDDIFAIFLDRTCYYIEAGGQVGDTGTITTETGEMRVTKVARLEGGIVHGGYITKGKFEGGQTAHLRVDPEREFTRKNHTATHLLHWALHRVLGEHVEQRGSKVKPDEFTFDFSHTGPVTDAEKAEAERLVNEKIYADLPVQARELSQADAKKLPGVKAFFGDKYGDVVRVVEVGDGFSREFCGGTHLEHTGQIGFFKIVGEEAVGKGVRRLTCVTAREAVRAVQEEDAVLAELTARFRCRPAELPAKVESLQEEIKRLQQQLKKGATTDLAGAADKLLAAAETVGGVSVIIGELPAGPDEQIRAQIDRIKQTAGSAVVVVGWADDGKVGVIAAATDDLVKKGVHAGKLVGEIAKVVGGGGGGRPNMAQAGGKDPAKLADALELARTLVRAKLG